MPPLPLWKQRFLASVALGAIAGGLLLVLAGAFDGLLPAPRAMLPKIVLWKRLLASLYGGVTEECIVHLFLMSILAWLLLKLLPAGNTNARPWIVWLALALAALLFALGHLPAVAAFWPLTSAVVLRTVVLNGLGGVLFGWLFWRWGFEFAVIAHLCADLVLHGIVLLTCTPSSQIGPASPEAFGVLAAETGCGDFTLWGQWAAACSGHGFGKTRSKLPLSPPTSI